MRFVFISAVSIAICACVHAQTFALRGLLTTRGTYATGQASWLEGGFGRMDVGSSGVSDHRYDGFAIAQLGVDWQPSRYFDVHVHGLARREPSGYRGRRAGIPEAFAEVRTFIGNDTLQLRAGEFFLPTSRENKGDLWSSPYTVTLSALNSWIAHEFRPIGAELEWKHEPLTLAAIAFRGNDSTGALIAWRGWAVGNRLSVYGEVVPLPPLFSLRDPRIFAEQRPDGTKSFGRDLDGRTGYGGRIRWQSPGRAVLQYAHADNRGDRLLHRGDYAWNTRFNVISGEIGSTDSTIFASEYAVGTTGMGIAPRPFVRAHFSTAYILVSHVIGRDRFSARFDTFQTEDRDRTIAESNTEHGRAWTLAWMHDIGKHLRTAVELTNVTGRRLAAEQSGFSGNTDGRSVIVELRYRFATK